MSLVIRMKSRANLVKGMKKTVANDGKAYR